MLEAGAAWLYVDELDTLGNKEDVTELAVVAVVAAVVVIPGVAKFVVGRAVKDVAGPTLETLGAGLGMKVVAAVVAASLPFAVSALPAASFCFAAALCAGNRGWAEIGVVVVITGARVSAFTTLPSGITTTQAPS